MMKKLITLSMFILLIPTVIFSQGSSIKGKVIDGSNGEELIGATVFLEGTTIGSSVDIDGNYHIENISPGKYNVKCQYIAFNPKTISEFEVKANSTKTIDFILTPSSLALEEVVIAGKAMRRTENAMLNLQMKSASLIDGISAQQISRSGDSDAASALKRVTGLSVQNGKYVYIRGLSDRYMLTTLNGAEIPGLDPNRNTVQMDLFPANILETIIVNKSFTPDLPANFSGGLVNIITRDFPESFNLRFSASLGFNTQATFNKNYLTYQGSSTDWLGYDNGFRNIPSSAKGKIPKVGDINEYKELTNITASFKKNWEQKKSTPFLNQSYALSIGNQTKLFKKPLGYFVAATYSNAHKFYDQGIRSRYQLIDGSANELINDYRYQDMRSESEANWSVIGNLSYKLSNKHKIGLMLMKNQSGTKTTRFLSGPNPEIDPNIFYQTRIFDFMARGFTSAQLKGEHQIEGLNNLKIDWIGSFSQSIIDQPDFRNFNNSFYIAQGDTIFEIDPSKYAVPSRFYRNLKESNIFGNINLQLPIEIFGAKGKLKFGGTYSLKDRTFRDKRFDFKDQNNSFTGNIPEYFSNDNIGINAASWQNEQLLGVFVSKSEKTNQINSYDGKQANYAGYLMADYQIANKIRLIFGARMERTYIKVKSFSSLVKEGELDDLDILPALNITYKITDRMNLRSAYSRTLARPSFRELAPYASFDFMGGDVIVGNPNLKRTLIDNVDLRWEYFHKTGEIVALSAFYKGFLNPIEKTYNPDAASPELTWRNVDKAKVYGLEAEFRKKLDFIPWLSNFKIGANASWIYSQVDVDPVELAHIHKSEANYPKTRVMAGQSPYIINGLLSYQNDSIGLESNISFNVFGKRLSIVNSGGTPNIYEQAFPLLNFNISKKLGSQFKIKFSAKNIINPLFKQTFSRWNEKNTWKDKEYIYQSYKSGQTFTLTFSYHFQ